MINPGDIGHEKMREDTTNMDNLKSGIIIDPTDITEIERLLPNSIYEGALYITKKKKKKLTSTFIKKT